MIYCFGHYQIDTQTCELYRGAQLCKVESRAFEILSYLITHRDHIVSREELVEHLWPGQTISQAVVGNAIKAARQAIGDSGDEQRKIRTIYGRGYRFVAQAQSLVASGSPEPMLQDEPSPSVDAAVGGDMAAQNVLVGDYRFVTVLCGTLEHRVVCEAGLDVAVISSLRRRFFAMAKAEAQRHGAIFKFYGADGFLLLVGLPVAHDDHVKRAVLSGLRIRDGLAVHDAAGEMASWVEATVRMGLHTGIIKIENGQEPNAWTPVIALEVAARALWLHDQAEGGAFLCSQAALPELQAVVEYADDGAIAIPREALPMMAYRIGKQSSISAS